MWPLIEIAVHPTSEADRRRLRDAVQKLSAQDPTFRAFTDREGGRTILAGASELHLDSKIDILRRVHGVEAAIGAPQVAYRETLGRRTDIDYTHKKQTGGPASSRG